MKRHGHRSSFAAALLLMSSVAPGWVGATLSLDVFTWSEYVDPELVAEFEAEFGADVRFSYFGTDEERDKELTASGGAGFDVILVSGMQLSHYVKRGWIAPLDTSIAPHLAHLDPRWDDASAGAGQQYGAAYFWGTLGIAWRSDLYPAGFTSWKQLLEPDPTLADRILMPGFGRELVGFALMADGHSINTTDRALIREAGRKLLQQKPFVRAYGYPVLTADSSLISGEIWASPMYSGDALQLKALDDRIEYRLPREGGQLWVDYLTVANDSKRQALATAFIDFLNRPAVAARNAEYVYYATPNLAAQKLVSAEYLADPVIHPSPSQLGRSEFFRSLPARSTKSVNTVVSELLAE